MAGEFHILTICEQPPALSALSIGSPDDDALALQSCNLVNRFTDAVQTYNRHTMCTHAILLKTTQHFPFLHFPSTTSTHEHQTHTSRIMLLCYWASRVRGLVMSGVCVWFDPVRDMGPVATDCSYCNPRPRQRSTHFPSRSSDEIRMKFFEREVF